MSETKQKRQYHKITPSQIARYKALEAILGNGSQAVRILTPSSLAPGARAFKIVKKSKEQNTVDFIDYSILQFIQIDGIRLTFNFLKK